MQISLYPKPPYDFHKTLEALIIIQKNRAAHINLDKQSYKRFVLINDAPILFELRSVGTIEDPEVLLIVSEDIDIVTFQELKNRLISMFGFNEEIMDFYSFLSTNVPHATGLIDSLYGLRFVRDFSLMESIIKAILSQQVNLSLAGKLIDKITYKFGKTYKHNNETYYSFPDASAFSSVEFSQLRELGIPKTRSECILSFAKEASGTLFENLHNLKDKELEETLCKVKGVGPWTAQMIMLFGLGKKNILPRADIGLHRAIEVYYGFPHRLVNTNNIDSYCMEWSPYKSMMSHYMWEFKMQNVKSNLQVSFSDKHNNNKTTQYSEVHE